MIKRLFSALLLAMVSTLVLAAVPVSAYDPFSNSVCRGVAANESAVCVDGDSREDPITGSEGIILRVVNIIAFVAGAAAVIFIILAGLRMITAAGSSDEFAGARKTVIYAAIGLVVIVFARTLVAFIIGRI